MATAPRCAWLAAAQQAKQAQGQARRTLAAPQRDSIAIASASLSRRPAGGAGGAAVVPPSSSLRVAPKQGLPDDWLAKTFGNTADTSEARGISSPWQPASRPGGGAALPPRGGSGSGAQATTVALVQGHAAALQTPPAPASTPAIPFLPSNGSAHDPTAYGSGKAFGGHHAGSGGAAQVGGGPAPAPAPIPADSPDVGGPSIIHENPSSEPSSSVGNGSGFSQQSFQYFPIYVMDENNGIILFNGQYQQAALSGTIDLYAQVKGTTVSTYSWTYNDLQVYSDSGASTYHFHVVLDGTQSYPVGSISLTVTNSSSQQESETFYFATPSAVTMPYSASWPTTIPPDLEEPGAPMIPSQGVSVDADSGALDADIDLPSYNPNVPAMSWTYNSMTANPEPIIVVHHQLDPTQTTPTAVNATLTLDSTVGTTWYYNNIIIYIIPGDVQHRSALAGQRASKPGAPAEVQLLGASRRRTTRAGPRTTRTPSASRAAPVLNQSSSAFGDGWTLEGLEQITADGTSGVILSLGDNGESLWFAGNPAVGSNYTTPVGDFSTLTLTSSGYTRTLPNGTQILFNSSGYETATIDLNNNHMTYSYNGSNQLTSIEASVRELHDLSPTASAHLSTYRRSGQPSVHHVYVPQAAIFEAVQQADSPRVTYTYDGSGRMTQVQDQRSNITSIAYDSAERVGTISLPEGATQLFSSYQEQGWTNSGTSGSPAAATLQAEAATTYTDPDGYSSQIRPDWMGLGRIRSAEPSLAEVVA